MTKHITGIKNLLDTKSKSTTYILEIGDTNNISATKRIRTRGELINPLPSKEGKFLFGKRGINSKIYMIDANTLPDSDKKLSKLTPIDGGQFTSENLKLSIDGYVIHWYMGASNLPEAALVAGRDGSLRLDSVQSDLTTSTIKAWDSSKEVNYEKQPLIDRIIPLTRARERLEYYGLEVTKDLNKIIYRVNYETKDIQELYKSSDSEILGVIISPESREFIGVNIIKNGVLKKEFFHQDFHNTQHAGNTSDEINVISSVSTNNESSIIYREHHSVPGHYIIKNNVLGTEKFLDSYYPHLHGNLSSRLITSHVVVDGLKIPYLLSLPENSDQNIKIPLIVMPHGGPIGVFDNQYFDITTQYFVSKGYAVLRINFRGSSGYGKKFEKAGSGEFDRLILTDIYSATKEVIERPDIDGSRVCSAGFSYGGYASSMMVIKHPDIFSCAASIAGVSDINLFLNSPFASRPQIQWLHENIGDSEKQYDRFKNSSPVYLAKDLHRPLFIAHGAQDMVVSIEHSHRLVMMLETLGKQFEWAEFPDDGHHFDNKDRYFQLMESVVSFIDKNIDKSTPYQ
ncbi:alpha/beta hydrolase family protein [Thalassolituus maritimus]|uniref:alpha/beta hydrolase family protein n=1 Tax=Thalassolituus maritimus TaxID=484498 RepID=UPI00334113AC